VDWRIYLFSFNGRLNRAKQWLIIVLLSVPALVYEYAVKNSFGLDWREFGRIISGQDLQHPSAGKILMLMVPLWLATVIPTLAVGIKRLHDRNKSGWWIILFVYAPWALSFFQVAQLPGVSSNAHLSKTPLELVFGVAVFGLQMWGFVELFCLRGTVGPNRFGPDPLGTPVEHVFE
jgi:uncharacterized membrane protein YhaH (DUF805 family)